MVVCSLTEGRISRDVLSRPLADIAPRIVHLGLGAFARAHLAEYVRRVNDKRSNDPWLICGVSLRNPDVRDALTPQQGVYTIIERDGPRDNPNDTFVLCDSLSEVLFAGDDAELIRERLAAAETQIISMTVTEKGYCRRADGTLDVDSEDVSQDIQTLKKNPYGVVKTLPGWLAQAIIYRSTSAYPVTVISLDNLPDNGQNLKQIVGEMLGLVNESAARWMGEGNVSFPGSVLDRIVPATTDVDRADVEAHLKFYDAWPIATEPYNNWVLEDNFCSDQPNWREAGVTVVADATPFEEAKLRLLNGPHSFIAYLGQLTDLETVADVMRVETNRLAVHGFMEEAAQTLRMPTTFDVGAYQREILARFDNVALQHRTAQIAMDGSEKVPQRWLAVIEVLRERGESVRFLAAALAIWTRYLEGVSESGVELVISDPRTEQLTRIAASNADQVATDVLTLLQSDLSKDEALISDVTRYYRLLADEGAGALIKELVTRTE
ncbi:MAG TPA: mannitol dehydrogenase [Gammaproteobacteria bacterium]|nr:mannitol dehydrogenase [Gammaproteobacteria bacterium]